MDKVKTESKAVTFCRVLRTRDGREFLLEFRVTPLEDA